MTPPPIYEAIPALRGAIYRALIAKTTRPVAWQQAAQTAARPLVIMTSQDGGGQSEKSLGSLAWSGLVTLRALADSQLAAEQLMAAVAPGMESLSAPGYTVMASYERPIVLPPTTDGVWQACHMWRVFIDRL